MRKAILVEFDDADELEVVRTFHKLVKDHGVELTAMPAKLEFGKDYRGMKGEPLPTGHTIPSRSAGVYQRWVSTWETIDAKDWNELGAVRSGRDADDKA